MEEVAASAPVVVLAPLEESVVQGAARGHRSVVVLWRRPLRRAVPLNDCVAAALLKALEGGGAAMEHGLCLRYGVQLLWRLRLCRLWRQVRHGLWLATSAATAAQTAAAVTLA